MSNLPPPPPPPPPGAPAPGPRPGSGQPSDPYGSPYGTIGSPPPFDSPYRTSTVAPPPPVERVNTPSVGRGILFGLGAGIVGGLLWYLIVAGTKRQFLYGAAILGLFIGWAVVKGAATAGPIPAVIGALIALITVVISYYYIDRYLFIKGAEDAGFALDFPLFPGFNDFKLVLREGFKAEKSQYLFSGIAVAAAALVGFTGGNAGVRRRR